MSQTKKAYTAYPVLQAELTKVINIQDIRDFSSKIKTLDDYQLEDEWLIHLLHEKNNGSLKIRQKENEIVFEPSNGMLPAESLHTVRHLKEGFIKVVSKKSPLVIKLYENGEITPSKIIIAFMHSEYDIDSESEPVVELQNPTLNKMATLNKQYASEGGMV